MQEPTGEVESSKVESAAFLIRTCWFCLCHLQQDPKHLSLAVSPVGISVVSTLIVSVTPVSLAVCLFPHPCTQRGHSVRERERARAAFVTKAREREGARALPKRYCSAMLSVCFRSAFASTFCHCTHLLSLLPQAPNHTPAYSRGSAYAVGIETRVYVCLWAWRQESVWMNSRDLGGDRQMRPSSCQGWLLA